MPQNEVIEGWCRMLLTGDLVLLRDGLVFVRGTNTGEGRFEVMFRNDSGLHRFEFGSDWAIVAVQGEASASIEDDIGDVAQEIHRQLYGQARYLGTEAWIAEHFSRVMR